MRLDFEHELQQAQAEVTKAQDALKTAEDRVRAVEQVERQKIISGVSLVLPWSILPGVSSLAYRMDIQNRSP